MLSNAADVVLRNLYIISIARHFSSAADEMCLYGFDDDVLCKGRSVAGSETCLC